MDNFVSILMYLLDHPDLIGTALLELVKAKFRVGLVDVIG